jgi:hypothetical protein
MAETGSAMAADWTFWSRKLREVFSIDGGSPSLFVLIWGIGSQSSIYVSGRL